MVEEGNPMGKSDGEIRWGNQMTVHVRTRYALQNYQASALIIVYQ